MGRWIFVDKNIEDNIEDVFSEEYYLDKYNSLKSNLKELIEIAIEIQTISIETIVDILNINTLLGLIYRHNLRKNYNSLTELMSVYPMLNEEIKSLEKIDVYSIELYEDITMRYIKNINRILSNEFIQM